MFKVEEPRAKSARLAPDLKALAHDLGIETAYLDNTGRRREATHEATLALLRALSVDVETPRDARLMRVELQRKHAERGAPHACVAWAGALDSLTVLRAPGPSVRWKACLKLEDGRTWEREGTLPEQSGSPQEVRLSLGWQLPLGYHELALSVGARTTVTLVIAPPAHAPRCAGRTFGLFAPVYALRGASRQGSGTLRELEELCTWSADRGASFVGTLPIMAQFLDEPCDTSPFAPASRLFWNELVLDLDALHGLEGCEHARTLRHSERFVQALGELEASTHVQARRKVALVHELLEPLAGSKTRAFARSFVSTLTLVSTRAFERWSKRTAHPTHGPRACARTRCSRRRRGPRASACTCLRSGRCTCSSAACERAQTPAACACTWTCRWACKVPASTCSASPRASCQA